MSSLAYKWNNNDYNKAVMKIMGIRIRIWITETNIFIHQKSISHC